MTGTVRAGKDIRIDQEEFCYVGAFRMPGAPSRVTRRHPVHKDIPSQALLLVIWKRSVHMSNRVIIACILWVSVFTAIALAGCSQEKAVAQGGTEFRSGGGEVLSNGFRIRRDAERDRIWLLGVNNVRVYDGQSKRLIREIELPNWSVARFACDPDMVLDASGSAIVSSNVQPRLWRIDASSLEVSEHAITLEGREGWDVGLGALAINTDGALLALTSVSESLWSIDLGKGSARMFVPFVPAATLLNVCGLTARSSSRSNIAFELGR